MSKQPRVHLVPTGTMPAYTPQPRRIALRTPPRFMGGPQSSKFHMFSMVETFKTYGVNANPFKAGTTSGDKVVISRRNTSKFQFIGRS